MTVIRWIVGAVFGIWWGFVDAFRVLRRNGHGGYSPLLAATLDRAPVAALPAAPTPVEHLGAESWGDLPRLMAEDMEQTRDVEVVGRVLLEDTGEFCIVADWMSTEVTDILGTWDPSAVNWEEPAVYRELTLDRMRSWGPLVDPGVRADLVSNIADTVLCGVG